MTTVYITTLPAVTCLGPPGLSLAACLIGSVEFETVVVKPSLARLYAVQCGWQLTLQGHRMSASESGELTDLVDGGPANDVVK